MENQFDLVIIGGGVAGYVSAIRASQLGMKVAIVEKNKLGGTCLHKGCIPTKTYLTAAKMLENMRNGAQFGLFDMQPQFDFEHIQNRKDDVVNQMFAGIQYLMKKNNITVFLGTATLLGSSIFSPQSGTISVDLNDGTNQLLTNKFVLICTGSKPKVLPFLPFDHQYVLSSDDMMKLKTLPKSIAIIGGGVIGIEFASLLTDLNVEVTIIEAGNQILPNEDEAMAKRLQSALEKRGVQFIFNCQLNEHTVHIDDNVHINVDGNIQSKSFDKVLVAIGRTANIEQLGLQNTKIEIEQGVIKVNEMYQTKEPHIYAVGDVIGGMQLAHVASKEGMIAIESMNDLHPMPIYKQHIPRCIYSNPEMATIGITTLEAKQMNLAVEIKEVPLNAIGKIVIENHDNGIAKIITDKNTNDILGVTILGHHATELINEVSFAQFMDASGEELGKCMRAHPSASELLSELGLASINQAIHI